MSRLIKNTDIIDFFLRYFSDISFFLMKSDPVRTDVFPVPSIQAFDDGTRPTARGPIMGRVRDPKTALLLLRPLLPPTPHLTFASQ